MGHPLDIIVFAPEVQLSENRSRALKAIVWGAVILTPIILFLISLGCSAGLAFLGLGFVLSFWGFMAGGRRKVLSRRSYMGGEQVVADTDAELDGRVGHGEDYRGQGFLSRPETMRRDSFNSQTTASSLLHAFAAANFTAWPARARTMFWS